VIRDRLWLLKMEHVTAAVHHDMTQIGKTGAPLGHFGFPAKVFRWRITAVDT
jgi:hypothetical protein